MEVEITWPRIIHVWWALAWRGFIVLVGGVAGAAVLGALFGIIFARAGVPKDVGLWFVRILGFSVGLGISIVPIKIVLGKEFGDFKLTLVQKQA